jgi:hypothetical protein
MAMAARSVQPRGHPAEWWAQFPAVSEKFDAASITEALADVITPKIPSPLLRREAEIAAEIVVLQLNRPQSEELAARAMKAVHRLVATVERLTERATGEETGTEAAYALCHALSGNWAGAAAEAEPLVGTKALLMAFVKALRLERFDNTLTVRLLRAGQSPQTAVQAGLVVGRYAWWPDWLIKIVTERALAGRLDEETITALDQCAYAELSPAQAKMARRLLNGDATVVDGAALRLETMGEPTAAAKLREGDLTAVALAARLIPL